MDTRAAKLQQFVYVKEAWGQYKGASEVYVG
jgi:hypothetical protein